MKRLSQTTILASLLAVAASALGAETNAPAKPANAPAPAPPRRTDFESFKLVTDRNIFNGNRSGQRVVARGTTQRAVRVDSFTLVGTMSSDKGDVAFFDGTESDYRKALKLESKIGNFVVKEIWPAGVKLVEGTNEIALRVGTALRREDEGYWRYAEPATSSSSSGSSSSWSASTSSNNGGSGRSRGSNNDRNNNDRGRGNPTTTAMDSSSAGPSSGDVNDILRKLMEKREKENQ